MIVIISMKYFWSNEHNFKALQRHEVSQITLQRFNNNF